jgi:hypothetical protein
MRWLNVHMRGPSFFFPEDEKGNGGFDSFLGTEIHLTHNYLILTMPNFGKVGMFRVYYT